MNFQQLETLIWIAKTGSFGTAALKMHSTQPAISARVRELERELGVTLFERSDKGAVLTARGRQCLQFAEKIMATASELRLTVSARDRFTGQVLFGTTDTVARTWLPRLLTRLSQNYPALDIAIEIDQSLALLRRFEHGELDMIVIQTSSVSEKFESVRLAALRPSWIGKPGSFDANKTYGPADLSNHRVLTWGPYATATALTEAWFTDNGAAIRKPVQCNAQPAAVELLRAGYAIGILMTELLRSQIESGELMMIKTFPELPPLDYAAIFRPKQVGSPEPAIGQFAKDASFEFSSEFVSFKSAIAARR